MRKLRSKVICIVSKLLEDEMRDAFRKSQEFLDFETKTEKEEEIINQRVVRGRV